MNVRVWTGEKISTLSVKEIENLRQNALRLNNQEILDLCDLELGSRVQSKPKSRRATRLPTDNDYVSGYHFVCDRERGVEHLKEGLFWSGSWVVAEANAEQSKIYGAYIALHESKSEPSYLQGEIIDFRKAPRSMIDKDNLRIEFQARATSKPYDWIGSSAGEKGYLWEPIKTHKSVSDITIENKS